MIDNKVIARLSSELFAIGMGAIDTLKEFIYSTFKAYPETSFVLGDFLPVTADREYIKKYTH